MKIFFLSCLLFCGFNATAQEYVWAQTYLRGNTSFGGLSTMTTDTAGNVYLAGAYTTPVTIGGTSLATPTNGLNFFIAKVEPTGHTDWVRPVTSNYTYYQISNLTISSDSNSIFYTDQSAIYSMSQTGIIQEILYLNANIANIAVQGGFLYFTCYVGQDTVYLGDSAFVSNVINSSVGIIAKYDLTNSHYVWQRQVSETPTINSLNGLIVDTAGNAYVCGATSTGFVTKINAGGSQWVKNYGTPGANYTSLGMCMDNHQHIYYAAQSSTPGFATMLLKINEAGQEIWSKQCTTTQNWGSMACTDHAIYLTGNDWNIPSDTINLGDTTLRNSNNNYILCLDTAGKFNWLTPYNGIPSHLTSINYLATSKNGLVYSAGNFTGSMHIGSSGLTNPPTNFYSTYLALLYNPQDLAPGSATIHGRVYFDNNNNCVFDSTATPAKYFGVVAQPGNYMALTDASGFYNISVPTGSYTVSELLPEFDLGQITQVCPANGQYSTGQLNQGQVDTANDFVNQVSTCAYTAIQFAGNYHAVECQSFFNVEVYVCNYTVFAVDSVVIQIGVSDSITGVTTSPPYDYQDSVTHNLVFQNRNITSDTCLSIVITGEHICSGWEFLHVYSEVYPVTVNITVPNTCTGSDNSDTTYAYMDQSIGVGNILQNTGMQIYPNPFHDWLNIVPQAAASDMAITVSDITGKEIKRLPLTLSGKQTIDLGFLASGAYILTYQSNQGTNSKLIIKD